MCVCGGGMVATCIPLLCGCRVRSGGAGGQGHHSGKGVSGQARPGGEAATSHVTQLTPPCIYLDPPQPFLNLPPLA